MCEIQFHVKISENGCWEWQGHKMNNGYGYISINQNKLLAHRISYKIFKGDVPDDKVLRHKCNNPICIYPEHLLIGDQRDNVHDAIRCGNIKRKLNWSQVCDMRIRHEKGEAIKDLRREFSIDYKTCQDIIKMKKWKKNPDET